MDVWKNKAKSLKSPWKCTSKVLEKSLKKVCHDLWEPCHGAWLIVNGFRTITDSVIHLWSWDFLHMLPMSQGCALFISGSKGQRSRSWGIDDWKWFPDHNWLCNPPITSIMKLHALAPHESRMCPLVSGSKGQRSRSWGIDDWKHFPDHNWPCNPPIIMKLHALAPHESRMRPIYLGVKRSKVKVVGHWWFKMVSGP